MIQNKNTSHILIVDDNSSLRKTMALILTHKGYIVTMAQDGPEAIEQVKERLFDVIFLDIKMPLMNGVETYKHIKEIRPDALVFMMTAYALEDLIQEALQEGAYGILYKPLDIDKMIVQIEEAKTTRQGALILVIDDDPGICFALQRTLRQKGYEVDLAQSGEEAIALARRKHHDVLFIDMRLPVINGLETYLRIKDLDPYAIAIMMTGYSQETSALVETALKNHAYTCLYKPFEMGEVLRVLEEIRARKHQEKQ